VVKLRAYQFFRRLLNKRVLIAWIMISIGATVMAPFQSEEMASWPMNGLYWSVVVGGSIFFSFLSAEIVDLVIHDRRDWRHDVARIVCMTLGFSPFLYIWTRWMSVTAPENLPSLPTMAFFVALVGTLVHSLRRILRGDSKPDAPQDEPAEATVSVAPAPRLLRRLPDGAEGPILRLSADDHFVEVCFADACLNLRMRFADAIAEMDGVPGECSHRSHWVAFAAVSDVKRTAGRISLILSNGDEVPVSRTYRPRWEAAGILQP
jgi:hypothetical protein